MKIGDLWRGGRGGAEPAEEAPRGPWSDLPPSAPTPRPVPFKTRRPPRQPIISNWRGLLIVLFLLIVAPVLARCASTVILGLLPGH